MAVSTRPFVREARIAPPPAPGGDVDLVAPPEVSRPVPNGLAAAALPALMVVAVVGMIALMFVTGGRSVLANPLFLMFPMMMLMSMFGMFATGGRGNGKRAAELGAERRDYFRYLAQLRGQVSSTVDEQSAALRWSHPAPTALSRMVGSRRMWERRHSDPDFAHLRVGVGSQRLATRLVPAEMAPPEDLEPVAMVALRRFLRAHAAVHRLPIAVSMRGFPVVAVDGPADSARALVRAMLVQLAVWHGPDQVRIAIAAHPDRWTDWDWIKWLPHAARPDRPEDDAHLGAPPLLVESLHEVETELAGELTQRTRFTRGEPGTSALPHVLIVLDGGRVTGDERLAGEAGIDGVAICALDGALARVASRRGLSLELVGTSLAARTALGVEEFAVADQLSIGQAAACARRLAAYRPSTQLRALVDLDDAAAATDPGLAELLDIDDARDFDPTTRWRRRVGRERLRVPIGYTPDGSAVELDLKESAHGGMGPHGLCVGATGSGKSELLRTLVLALMATHSPDELNLVLVDFKGGATFLGLERSRHVAAVITNLEQELALVDRMADALRGELNRRQELLRSAGNFANVTEYEQARESGAALPPLPALFVVVDEFSELLAQKPDFAELFVAIGRLGRSLHIHLLLASQRLEEGKLRGLDSHLSYRIGLKTFSANESRSVLGVPDAYHLPNVPGSAYLKCDSDAPRRFNTCYVSGPVVDEAAAVADPASAARVGRRRNGWVLDFTAIPPTVPTISPTVPTISPTVPTIPPTVPTISPTVPTRADEPTARRSGPSLLDLLVDRMAGYGSYAHEVWLPPLDEAPLLGDLVEPLPAEMTGITGALRLPIGIVDRPYDQRRELLVVDLSGAAGNVAIVGGPQSGKSTAVRTLIAAAALTHAPAQVQFYCLDFGGGGLAGLGGLPHVGSVATRSDPERIRRTLAEVRAIMARREEIFARLGVESMRDYRARREPHGTDPSDPHGDVFLVIDGIGVLREEYEELEAALGSIALGGLSYGVHVVVTGTRWAQIHPSVRDLLGSRVELRLGDPLDSEMDRQGADSVPVNRPGRGITAEGLHLLVALPALTADGGAGELVEVVAEQHPGQPAPPVPLLPADLDLGELRLRLASAGAVLPPGVVPIGVGEEDLAPVLLDLRARPHLMVFADVEHGKTSVLATLASGLVEGATPDEAKLVVVDYRRTMLGQVPDSHRAGYASSAASAGPLMMELATLLEGRLPPEDITPERLAARDWWSGPDVYLFVDDYDMVATSSGNPLLVLVDLLPSARDIGFHVILARRSGGVSRALFDPVIARLRDLSTDTLLMSGDRDEGYIVGQTRMSRRIPGRGEFVTRTGSEVIHVARQS
ncbi:putative FtsK/SpoIIIE family protein [Gordonia araii NBRC 100433]|uniref:Putative FtsK/SpoIIIE family protein n=1 Tax=Gordonia araii NBRC 100433 TaxID=1073574 RepID=G7GZ70_9ACTN|nr:type VII secretion protein EccC [Gordonia araii]NNG97102.1 type VII secretion protein EccC [Gordonia araii NBRC 100433]GAB08895.1 putative FtsK/SpoIIIE family protein [Gordonia araii NBRC 100433]